MADIMLDASVFHAYLNGDVYAGTVVEQIVTGNTKASVSSLAVFQLWSDPNLNRHTEISFAAILGLLEFVPCTVEAAKVAGIWVGKLGQESRSDFIQCALIAAIAHDRSEPICTHYPELYGKFNVDVVTC